MWIQCWPLGIKSPGREYALQSVDECVQLGKQVGFRVRFVVDEAPGKNLVILHGEQNWEEEDHYETI